MAQEFVRTEYEDGSVVLSNLRNKKGVPVFKENDTYTATRVNVWYDDSPMTPEKADGKVYLRLKSTGEYFRVNLPNWGETFLEKNTVSELRTISSTEILLIKIGYYKGVKLNGYYTKGDTPSPIEYYLSNITEEDDGGSIFEVGGIKLQYIFIEQINVSYFGIIVETDITVKCTNVLNIAANKGLTVLFNDGRYLVNGTYNSDRGIVIPSNVKIETTLNTTFKVIPTDHQNYRCFSIINAQNITINRLYCIGERDEHMGTAGEYGMGIGIFSSKNIFIDYLECNNFWGDGVYIGKTAVSTTNNNIKINKIKVDNNRRQGMSLVTADGLFIDSIITTNTNGTSPQAGIDIEPNDASDILSNIVINNITSSGNLGNGLIVVPIKLNDTSSNVDIKIGKIYSTSEVAFSLQGSLINKIKGQILIDSIVSEKATGSSVYFRNTYNNLDCSINNVVSINANQKSLPTNFGSAIRVASDSSDVFYPDRVPSKIRISQMNVISTDNKIDRPILVTEFNRVGEEPSIDFQYDNFTYSGGQQQPIIISKSSKGLITNTIDSPNGITLAKGALTPSKVTNKGAIGVSYITINPYFRGYRLTLEVVEPYIFGIQNQNNFKISGYEDVAAGLLTSNRVGDTVTIEYIKDNTWAIIDIQGRWSVMGLNAINFIIPATTTKSGGVRQTTAQTNISQADLANIATADGSDAATTQALANAIKSYINTNVVPLVNAIKASQNTELTNQRTAGQQAP